MVDNRVIFRIKFGVDYDAQDRFRVESFNKDFYWMLHEAVKDRGTDRYMIGQV